MGKQDRGWYDRTINEEIFSLRSANIPREAVQDKLYSTEKLKVGEGLGALGRRGV